MLDFSHISRFLDILLPQSAVTYLPFLWHRGRQNGHLPCVQSRPDGGRCKAVLQQCPAGIGPHRRHWPELQARWSPPQTLNASLQWKPKQERRSGHRTGHCKALIPFISGPLLCEKCHMNYLWYCCLLGKEMIVCHERALSHTVSMWCENHAHSRTRIKQLLISIYLQHAMTLYLKRLDITACYGHRRHLKTSL